MRDSIHGKWPCDLNPTPIELVLRDPAAEQSSQLPGNGVQRRRLDDLPERICLSKECGWETRVDIRRGSLGAAYDFIYEGDCGHLPGLDGDEDDVVSLFGWWD